MRRWMIVAALLLFLPVWSEAQSCDGCGIGYRPSPTTGVAGVYLPLAGGTLTGPLLLPDGTAANPPLAFANYPTTGIGVVSTPALLFGVSGATRWVLEPTQFYPNITDLYAIGVASRLVTHGYFSRSIQGSKTKALTESSATTVATVAVPQTAGSNFAAGEVKYTVYASDGTDSQALNGVALFSAVNKAGTETCTIEDDQITAEAASTGTLTCTVACAVGLTDVVGITFDCASSLTQTSLNALVRFDMQQPNTLVFP